MNTMFSPSSGRAERIPSMRNGSANMGVPVDGAVNGGVAAGEGELGSVGAKMRSHSLTMSPRNVSTLTTDLRMGRSQNYTSSSSSSSSKMRNPRSPNRSGRRYSVTECEPPRQDSLRGINSEQVIDLMEREQDAIVLKLMREIAQLKDEIKQLKSGSSSSGGSLRRSSSVSSQKSSLSSSVGTLQSAPSNTATSTSRNSSLSNYKLESPFKDTSFDTELKRNDENRKKAKRKPSHDISHMGIEQEATIYNKLKSVDEENAFLRQENEILKKQLADMRRIKSKEIKM